mmetsp:Transcript_20212/g.24909  ORF Transcript_20212/g.24909 Transcript_20212/m.24909 type:complete len:114 (+) Transcript_20212:924-1265(+)
MQSRISMAKSNRAVKMVNRDAITWLPFDFPTALTFRAGVVKRNISLMSGCIFSTSITSESSNGVGLSDPLLCCSRCCAAWRNAVSAALQETACDSDGVTGVKTCTLLQPICTS